MALAAVLFVGGCGPVEYINQVTRTASSQVAAAKSAGADKYSPYYYTRAILYLRRAREEAAYADYQAANRFGRLAAEAADFARAESLRRAANPNDDTYIDATKKIAPLGGADDGGDGMAPLLEDGAAGSEEAGDDDNEAPPGLGGRR